MARRSTTNGHLVKKKKERFEHGVVVVEIGLTVALFDVFKVDHDSFKQSPVVLLSSRTPSVGLEETSQHTCDVVRSVDGVCDLGFLGAGQSFAMSDAFADLWNQSLPSRPTPPSQKALQQQLQPPQPRVDSFALLASSAPSSRPITPSKPLVHPTPNDTPSDAFSDLLSGSLKPSVNASTLTIAQRAAQVQRATLIDLQSKPLVVKNQPSPWDGLDALGASNPSPSTSLPPTVDDWGWTTETTTTSTSHKDQDNLLGLDDDDILGVLGKSIDAIPKTLVCRFRTLITIVSHFCLRITHLPLHTTHLN
jgi:hypothetical protein